MYVGGEAGAGYRLKPPQKWQLPNADLMLYEEARAGLYLPVIFWIWRERLVKSNNGRWDYLGSLIEMWKDEAVYPDPQNITMTHPIMMAYQKYNALMCLMAGLGRDGRLNAAPVGGMPLAYSNSTRGPTVANRLFTGPGRLDLPT